MATPGLSSERVDWLKEIQEKLNASFQCDYSISVGKTRKFATSTSAGIILVDREFLRAADKDRLFFALAHEYAHAYLQHDLQLFEVPLEGKEEKADGKIRSLVETRRRFEKEADGIAARKAKQLGFDINNILEFILTMPDFEKGVPAGSRVYLSPRDRADYVLAVYQSS
ncbi:MAG: hypothetical protein U0V70_19000 [Terriglobia bacterium]